jgi:hypothetical protein
VNKGKNLRNVDRHIDGCRLNYYMSRYAERAISMPYITLVMRVSDRQSTTKDDQSNAQNAEEKSPRPPSWQGCLLDIHVTDYNATRAKLVAQGLNVPTLACFRTNQRKFEMI